MLSHLSYITSFHRSQLNPYQVHNLSVCLINQSLNILLTSTKYPPTNYLLFECFPYQLSIILSKN